MNTARLKLGRFEYRPNEIGPVREMREALLRTTEGDVQLGQPRRGVSRQGQQDGTCTGARRRRFSSTA